MRAVRHVTILLVMAGILISAILMNPSACFAASYTVTDIPQVNCSSGQTLGTIQIHVPSIASLAAGDTFTGRVPEGVYIPSAASIEAVSGPGESAIPQSAVHCSLQSPQTFTLQIDGQNLSDRTGAGIISLTLKNVDLYGISGDIYCTFSPSASGVFPAASLTIARAAKAEINWAVSQSPELERGSLQPIGIITLREKSRGIIRKGDTVTLMLPEGFVWDTAKSFYYDVDEGTSIPGASWSKLREGRRLALTMTDEYRLPEHPKTVNLGTSGNPLWIYVPEDAPAGKIVCQITGTGSIQPASLVIGTVKAKPTVVPKPAVYYALRVPRVSTGTNRDLGTIGISLPAAEGLQAGDQVTVTLPDSVGMPHYVKDGQVSRDDIRIDVISPASSESRCPISNDSIRAVMTAPNAFDIRVVSDPVLNRTGSAEIRIQLRSLHVSAADGDMYAVFSVPTGSAVFTAGTIRIAEGVSSFDVLKPSIRSVFSVERANSQLIDQIDIQVERKSAIPSGTWLTLQLPSGYGWDLTGAKLTGLWDLSGQNTNTWGIARQDQRTAQIFFSRPPVRSSGSYRVQVDGLKINVPATAALESDVPCVIALNGRDNRETIKAARVIRDKDVKPLTSIILSQHSLNLTEGGQSWLSVSPSPASAELSGIEWFTADESIAAVSSRGMVIAKKAGQTVITVRSAQGFRDTCAVTVSGENSQHHEPHNVKIIKFFIDRSYSIIDGLQGVIDAPPIIQHDSGRTLVPLRSFCESMDARVEWSPSVRQIRISDGYQTIILTVDSHEAIVNGSRKTIDSAPQILSAGRTYVPLRFISETLGASVNYDPNTRGITITDQ